MKVFSIKKFIVSCRQDSWSEEKILNSLKFWASGCDGLTPEEMEERYGYRCAEDWLIEQDGMEHVAKNSLTTEGDLISRSALLKIIETLCPCGWTDDEIEIQKRVDFSLFKGLVKDTPAVYDEKDK